MTSGGGTQLKLIFFCGRICTENSRQMTLEGRECGSGDEMMVMVMVDVDLCSASSQKSLMRCAR